jgi:flagellar motility protein MotE (MotC chaperone)
MKFLQSPLFAAILGGVLFLLTSAFLTTQGIATAPLADDGTDSAARPNLKGPSWDFFNPELDEVVADLRSERDSLTAREKQLNELATRLKAERAELDDALKGMKKIQQQVDRDLFRIKEDEAGNLKRLAKMYSAMEPASAARILRELDDVIIVKILTLMKEPETALILESFSRLGEAETKRAAAISENLRSTVSAKPSANK